MHLTNYSVNKKALAYVKNTNGPDQAGNQVVGGKTAVPQTGSAATKKENDENNEKEEAECDQNDNVDPTMEFKWSL